MSTCLLCSETSLSSPCSDSIATTLVVFHRRLAGWAPWDPKSGKLWLNSLTNPADFQSGAETKGGVHCPSLTPRPCPGSKASTQKTPPRRLQGSHPAGPWSARDRKRRVSSPFLEVSNQAGWGWWEMVDHFLASDEGPVPLIYTPLIKETEAIATI